MAIRGRIWSPNPRRVNVVWVLTPPKRRGHTSVRHQKSYEQCIIHCLGIWFVIYLYVSAKNTADSRYLVSETDYPIKVTVNYGSFRKLSSPLKVGEEGIKGPLTVSTTEINGLSEYPRLGTGTRTRLLGKKQGVTPRIIVWLLLAH